MRKQGSSGHQHPAYTIATLHRILLDKCLLHWMESAPVGQTFDRCDVFSMNVLQRHCARSNRLSVGNHKTGTADAEAASKARSGQHEIIAKSAKQRCALRNVQFPIPAINGDADLHAATLAYTRHCWKKRASNRQALGPFRTPVQVCFSS